MSTRGRCCVSECCSGFQNCCQTCPPQRSNHVYISQKKKKITYMVLKSTFSGNGSYWLIKIFLISLIYNKLFHCGKYKNTLKHNNNSDEAEPPLTRTWSSVGLQRERMLVPERCFMGKWAVLQSGERLRQSRSFPEIHPPINTQAARGRYGPIPASNEWGGITFCCTVATCGNPVRKHLQTQRCSTSTPHSTDVYLKHVFLNLNDKRN